MTDKRLLEVDRKHWAVESLLYASDKTINSFGPAVFGSKEARDFFFREYIREYRSRVEP